MMRIGYRSILRPNYLLPVTRSLSGGLKFLDVGEEFEPWPKSQANTLLNICPQGERMVIERLGKLHSVKESGWFLAIPLVDHIRFCIDMRERALNIPAQSAITKDNVHVQVSGNLYIQFVNPERAAYGSTNPIYAVKQHAQSCMRAALGELELDQILHARAQMNTIIRETVQEAALAWGMEIRRYEITEVSPDKFITEAMDKQAAAERERRKKVLEAEGDKRSAELQSEGTKIRLRNESEGDLIRVKNQAEAMRVQLILEGEGEATATKAKAEAQAEAISIIAKALNETGGNEAAKIHIAREYITMYGEMGQKSNTMIFSDRPADVNTLLAQAGAILEAGKTKREELLSRE